MATYRQKTKWWADYRCRTDNLTSVHVLDRYPVKVQRELHNATVAMDAVLRANGYPTPAGPIGSYLCRKISGTDLWSLHAYGIAIDIDYGNNPHLHDPIQRGFNSDPRFQLSEAQVEAVESIKNEEGDSIWKWLGWSIGDTMHFEADVPPDKCEIGGNRMEYRGVLNVPDQPWARDVVDWALEAGIIITSDDTPDDWGRLWGQRKDGHFWTYLKRFDEYLDRKWS